MPTDLEALVELLKDVVAFSLSLRDFIWVGFLWQDTRRVDVRRSLRCAGGGLLVFRCGGSPLDLVVWGKEVAIKYQRTVVDGLVRLHPCLLFLCRGGLVTGD